MTLLDVYVGAFKFGFYVADLRKPAIWKKYYTGLISELGYHLGGLSVDVLFTLYLIGKGFRLVAGDVYRKTATRENIQALGLYALIVPVLAWLYLCYECIHLAVVA
jgi:hypothetical protein